MSKNIILVSNSYVVGNINEIVLRCVAVYTIASSSLFKFVIIVQLLQFFGE